jgi:hypothetical protein
MLKKTITTESLTKEKSTSGQGGIFELGIPYEPVVYEQGIYLPKQILERAQSPPKDLIVDISGFYGLVISPNCLYLTLLDEPNTVLCFKHNTDRPRWGKILAHKDGFIVEVLAELIDREIKYFFISPDKFIKQSSEYHEIQLKLCRVGKTWFREQHSTPYYLLDTHHVRDKYTKTVIASFNTHEGYIHLYNSYNNCGQMVVVKPDPEWGEANNNYYLTDNQGLIIVALGSRDLQMGIFKFVNDKYLCWLDRGKMKIWDADSGILLYDKELELYKYDWPQAMCYPDRHHLKLFLSGDNKNLIVAGTRRNLYGDPDHTDTFLIYHMNLTNEKGTIIDCRFFDNGDDTTQGLVGISYNLARKKIFMLSQYTVWEENEEYMPFSTRHVIWSPQLPVPF